MSAEFILASGSPRRRELLQGLGLSPRIQPPDVDESVLPGESPGDYALRVAEDKARRIQSHLPVLAADTVVELDGVSLGKPATPADAQSILANLSGRDHFVHTGVVVCLGQQILRKRVTTDIRMRHLLASEIRTYVDSGEPMDKAGAYGIQGRGGALVANIRGSYTNVVGLPLEESLALLEKFGVKP